MKRDRRNKILVFCHMRKAIKEEKTRMFLSYYQQYDLVIEHCRQLEAEARRERLYRSIRKPKSRIWNFTRFLKPRVVGAEEWQREKCATAPVPVKVY